MDDPPGLLKRVRYFTGQLLTAADLTAEQEYFRNRLRRHNQWCHGSGIVGGLELTSAGGLVVVAPGLALDCRGDELVVAAPLSIRLPVRKPSSPTRFVVLSAAEELTDPVPGLLDSGASETPVTYGRILETSRLSLAVVDPAAGHAKQKRSCTPCGKDHGVVLGRLRWAAGGWRVDARYRRWDAAP